MAGTPATCGKRKRPEKSPRLQISAPSTVHCCLKPQGPPGDPLQTPLTLCPESGPRDTQGWYHFSPWSTHRHISHPQSVPPLWAYPQSPQTLAVRKGKHSITASEVRVIKSLLPLEKSLNTVLNTYLCSQQTRHESHHHSAPR